MDFSTVKSLTIPEGEVVKITVDGVVLWEKAGDTPTVETNHIKGTASAEFTATIGGVTLTFPAGNFDVVYSGSKPTTMGGVFNSKKTLTSITSFGIDTSAVINYSYMFYNCATMASVDVNSFNTAVATTFSNMFVLCTALTALDLSSFDTANVDNFGGMFWQCKNMKKLTLSSKFDMVKAKTVGNMFGSCAALTTITGGTLKNLSVSLSLSACPLDHDSAVRIINGLATVTTAQTLTLSDTTKVLLSDTEKAIVVSKGWTLA